MWIATEILLHACQLPVLLLLILQHVVLVLCKYVCVVFFIRVMYVYAERHIIGLKSLII